MICCPFVQAAPDFYVNGRGAHIGSSRSPDKAITILPAGEVSQHRARARPIEEEPIFKPLVRCGCGSYGYLAAGNPGACLGGCKSECEAAFNVASYLHSAPVALDCRIPAHHAANLGDCGPGESIVEDLAHCICNLGAILSAAVTSDLFSCSDIHDKNLIGRENLSVQIRKFAGDLAFIYISTQIYYTGRYCLVLIDL